MSDSNDKNNNDKSKNQQNLPPQDRTQTSHADFSGGELKPHHPNKIGQFVLTRVIASGGMGTVFEAMQENPKRPVALKVIKSGFADENAVERLEYEAQLLAKLRHPGIAQIYEAGSFDDNGTLTPYFAMEYIPNAKPINEYVTENNLTVDDKIKLFIQACDAVHHGHQRGIVHRDLKPSNILVDSSGRVRVIDFGIAKATDIDMRQAVAKSEHGQIIGTIQYMSPEQFEADPHDIDTRSDVYTLGLVLFELLSGALPYKTTSDRVVEFTSEVRSGKTMPLGEKVSSLKGDLESIVLMAVQRDRESRYQSAYGLAQDLQRFLNRDAVLAHSSGLSYQVQVFARKNKAIIGILTTAFVLLVVGVVVSTSLYFNVDKEKRKAEIAEQKAKQGQQFLSDVLTESFPFGYGDKVTVLDILDRASHNLDDAFPDDPKMEAKLRGSLGRAYSKVGHYDQAKREYLSSINLYTKSFGRTDEKVIEQLEALELMHHLLDEKKEELEISTQLAEIMHEKYGEKHLKTADYRYGLSFSQEEVGLLTESISNTEGIWELYKELEGENSISALEIQTRYSWLMLKINRIEKARQLIDDVIIRAENIEDKNLSIIENAKSCLAAIYIVQSKIDSARALYGYKTSPDDFGIEKTFQGQFAINKEPFQLLVFFETWCPYSKLAIKKLTQVDYQYNKLGLDVFGLTRVNKNAVDEDVVPYLESFDTKFAVVKDNGRSWNYYDCKGTPSIRLLYKGSQIWEPGSYTNSPISTRMLEGLVAAQSCGF